MIVAEKVRSDHIEIIRSEIKRLAYERQLLLVFRSGDSLEVTITIKTIGFAKGMVLNNN